MESIINLTYQKSKIRYFSTLLVSNLIVIWTCIIFYSYNPYYINFISEHAKNAIIIIAIFYSFVSIYSSILSVHRRSDTKGLIILKSVSKTLQNLCIILKDPNSMSEKRIVKFTKLEKHTLLFSLVKIIYIPIMLNFMFNNLFTLKGNFTDSITSFSTFSLIDFFNVYFFQLVLSIIFLVDTAYFCFGYIFEAGFLKNKVKSVDCTYSGWIFALACYPPFSSITSMYFPWSSNEYISFGDNFENVFFRILIIILLSIYLFATISLGTRCSNLTNRGIVITGAYKFVRHPAYISKNLVWWITLIPVLKDNNFAFLSMIGWSFMYFMRAITEEKHLLQDDEYQEYCKEVKFRFIPGVF